MAVVDDDDFFKKKYSTFVLRPTMPTCAALQLQSRCATEPRMLTVGEINAMLDRFALSPTEDDLSLADGSAAQRNTKTVTLRFFSLAPVTIA
jgi:hypothetical protein